MKALTNIEEIFQVAFGYMASKALFSALHLGVFDALAEGPKDLAALVEATETEERGLTTLLTALTAVGLLEKGEAGWVNSPAAAESLVTGAPGDFGDYLRYQIDRQMYPFMHNLTDVLKGRRDTVPFENYEAWFRDAAEATLYSESQHAASVAPAMLLAALVDLSQRTRLLDVGGGSGAFAITLCGMQPQLSVTILDFPNVLEVARKHVAAAGLESRIEFVAGNALTSDWPGSQDAVLFSYISGSVSAEGVGELYRRAFTALEPGGTVLIHDFMVDDDRTGPPLAAIWALQHATFTPDAVSLTPGFITGLLREIGFEEVSLAPFIPGMTRLVQAHKPS
ncbi:MAG: methyltransferase domain-containing protein [Deltaproteobacteria bacterium]|nr:methyltransferase domain-containing protein [Deltaproteobacteria bacterium]